MNNRLVLLVLIAGLAAACDKMPASDAPLDSANGEGSSQLCPRGEYAAGQTDIGVRLLARVKLGGPGYSVALNERPERVLPPMFNFVCEPPDKGPAGPPMIYPVETLIAGQYVGQQISITDAEGPAFVDVVQIIPVPDPIGTGETCEGFFGAACRNPNEFCKKPVATCGIKEQEGTCNSRPQACSELYSPVCGCDGNTYGNSCEAYRAGVNIAAPGQCNIE